MEKAAAPAPFVSIFTANEVRKEHVLQNDDTEPSMLCRGVALRNMRQASRDEQSAEPVRGA